MSKHLRLETNIIRALSDILRKEVKHPAIGFTTITAVKLTNDLSYLTVFYTNLDEDKLEDTAKALERSKSFIRSSLGSRVKMRKLPEIIFKYDSSLAHGNKIESGLKKVLKDEE